MGALIERPRSDRWEFYIEHYLRDIRLLDAGDLRRLFPGAKIVRERLGGMRQASSCRFPGLTFLDQFPAYSGSITNFLDGLQLCST